MSNPYELNAADLEAQVESQISSSAAYDFVANKALMKQYQLNPSMANIDIIGKILILALMHVDTSDFLALSYLVGKADTNPKLKIIRKLSELLASAQFEEFWKDLKNPDAAHVAGVNGFAATMRSSVLAVLQSSHKSISTASFREMLDLEDPYFDAFATASKDIFTVRFPAPRCCFREGANTTCCV